MEGVAPTQQDEPDNDHTLALSMEVVAYTIDKDAMMAPTDTGDGTQQIQTNGTTATSPARASAVTVTKTEEAAR